MAGETRVAGYAVAKQKHPGWSLRHRKVDWRAL